MGHLDKDRHQKECAIRFCLVSGMLPFLEVNVENRKELSSVSTVITDIDALGVAIDASGSHRKVVFDCKTLGKISPINRAFWASGLLQYAGCDEAFVILRKTASEAHRLSAKHVDVHLFGETQFNNFAESYSIDYASDYSYATDVNNWMRLFGIYSRGSVFEKFGDFLNHEVPLEEDAARGVKRLLSALIRGKGEFIPSNNDHMAVFQHVIMSFSLLMARIIHDLKTVIDFDSKKEDFEQLLKYYIWGGRGALLQRQKMADLFSSMSSASTQSQVEIPEWDKFVELTRKLLDSPKDVFLCCFPLRELSLRSAGTVLEHKDVKLSADIVGNSRLRQFITFQANYLVSAGELPIEFGENLNATFDELRGKK
jgi:hypothetical protein